MISARDEILARVRSARGADAAGRGAGAATPAVRDYRRAGERSQHELVELFCARAGDYRAEVERIRGERLQATLVTAAARHGARRFVVPPGLPDAWRPAELDLVADTGLAARELDRLDGVITGCTVAIAETGTIALSADTHEGRRQLSLVPDLHICVVRADQIVEGVPEAITQLGEIARAARRPLTLISGPSATSDIELERVEGVHGPRKLVVLVVADEQSR